jgi:hypothetical protein
MPGKSPGPSIKNAKVYEALRRRGYSKAKAAAISNAQGDKALRDRDLPLEVQSMPAAAKSIWRAAFRSSIKEEPERLAGQIALRAVQQKFSRVQSEEGEEEWVEKAEAEKAEKAAEAARLELELPELSEQVEELAAEAERLPGGESEEENGPKSKPDDDESDDDESDDDESDDEDEASYSRTHKTTTETIEQRGGRRKKAAEAEGEGEGEGGTGDSYQFDETFTLDADTAKRFGMRIRKDGYLVAEPRVARTGVQLYKGAELGRPDMKVVRVMRPDSEVFDRRAMSSLAHVPITLDHPDTSVNAGNWKELAVGHSTGDIARDGDYIRVPMMIADAAAIKAVQSGTSQLSVGYSARLLWGDGENGAGEKFDAMQVGIRANHIALVQAARGGEKLKIGDGEDGGALDREFSQKEREKAAEKGQAMPHGGFPVKSSKDLRNAIQAVGRAKDPAAAKAHIKKRARALGLTKLIPESWGDSADEQRSMTMVTRNIDGVTIELEDRDDQILARHLTALNSKVTDQGVDVEKLKAQIAALQAQLAAAMKGDSAKDGEIAALKQKVEDSKVTPEILDKELETREEVKDRAAAFFGDQNYAWKGKSNPQIRRDVVAARLGDQKTKTMNDDAVEGAFLSITEPEHQDGFARMTQSFSRPPTPNYNDKAATAYDKRNADLSNRWKTSRMPAKTAGA